MNVVDLNTYKNNKKKRYTLTAEQLLGKDEFLKMIETIHKLNIKNTHK